VVHGIHMNPNPTLDGGNAPCSHAASREAAPVRIDEATIDELPPLGMALDMAGVAGRMSAWMLIVWAPTREHGDW
jgi:hypothetical protein